MATELKSPPLVEENPLLNAAGWAEKKPTGWQWISMRSKAAKAARDCGKAVEVHTGWKKNYFGGNSRVMSWAIHPDYIAAPKPIKTVDTEKQARALKAAETRRTREKAKKQAEYQAWLAEQPKNVKAVAPKTYSSLFPELISGLSDPSEAAEEWLEDAWAAYKHSRNNKGVMHSYYLAPECGLSFYGALRLAIGAYRRHNDTDYDFLLERGVDRETAREMIRQ